MDDADQRLISMLRHDARASLSDLAIGLGMSLNGLSAVRATHTTNGRWDVIVEIGTETLEELDKVLAQIRRFEGIAQSETSLLLNTWKSGA